MTDATFMVTLENGAVMIRRADSRQPMTIAEAESINLMLQMANLTRATTESAANRPASRREVMNEPEAVLLEVVAQQAKAGWSNTQLAPLVGVHKTMFSHYRSGRVRVSLTVFKAWAYLVGLELIMVPWRWRGTVRQLLKELREVEVMDFENRY